MTKQLLPMSETVATSVVATAIDRYRKLDSAAELTREAEALYLSAMASLVGEQATMVGNGWSAGSAWESIAETLVKRAMRTKSTRIYAERLAKDYSANTVRSYAASAQWAIDNGLSATARILTPREAKEVRTQSAALVDSFAQSPEALKAMGIESGNKPTIAQVIDYACTGKGAVSPIALARAIKPTTTNTSAQEATKPEPSKPATRVDVLKPAAALARLTEIAAESQALLTVLLSGTYDVDQLKVLVRDADILRTTAASIKTKFSPKPETKPASAAA